MTAPRPYINRDGSGDGRRLRAVQSQQVVIASTTPGSDSPRSGLRRREHEGFRSRGTTRRWSEVPGRNCIRDLRDPRVGRLDDRSVQGSRAIPVSRAASTLPPPMPFAQLAYRDAGIVARKYRRVSGSMRGDGGGMSNDLPWASVFDSAANMRASAPFRLTVSRRQRTRRPFRTHGAGGARRHADPPPAAGPTASPSDCTEPPVWNRS